MLVAIIEATAISTELRWWLETLILWHMGLLRGDQM
jgi:hypothetical protein